MHFGRPFDKSMFFLKCTKDAGRNMFCEVLGSLGSLLEVSWNSLGVLLGALLVLSWARFGLPRRHFGLCWPTS